MKNDYFEFLEKLSVSTEVLTVGTGDRILKVIGLSDSKIVLSNQEIFSRETGELITKKKDTWNAIKQLTKDEAERIEQDKRLKTEKEEKEQVERLITNEFDELVGSAYRSKKPSIETQKKVIALIIESEGLKK